MKKLEVDRRISEELETLISNPNSDKKNTREEEAERLDFDDPWESFFRKWKKIFVTSCVLAVLLDPLFLYIPIVNKDMKCLSLDQHLKTAALTLRSVTDSFYIMDIVFRLYGSERLPPEMTSRCIIIDILAIIPIPQVIVLVFFSKLRGSTSFNTGKVFINVFVLLQYVPRVLRIYKSFQELKETHKEKSTALWVKGALNFFMYILASHVVGAVWYFYSILRMRACWQSACRKDTECQSSTFSCQDDRPVGNVTLALLSDLCPLSPPNTTVFDFGIYLNVLQSPISESTDYPQKFANCFWWGLRNLSSLGSNLQTSIYTWENLFAALISIIGLLLFLYLIGNLQTYMQLETARSEEDRYKEEHRYKMEIKQKMEIAQKMKKKVHEIESWLYKNGVPKRSNKKILPQIMEYVQQELEDNKDVHVENMLPHLPSHLRSHIHRLLSVGYESHPLTILKKVPQFQNMDDKVLKVICEYLKPKSYSENQYIVQKNDRLGMMLFITDGLVEIETSANDANPQNKKTKVDYSGLLKRGDFYGEELLDMVNHMAFPSVLPLSMNSARVISNVEALILTADDLSNVVSMFRAHFSESEFPIPKNAAVRLGLDKLLYFRAALRIR